MKKVLISRLDMILDGVRFPVLKRATKLGIKVAADINLVGEIRRFNK